MLKDIPQDPPAAAPLVRRALDGLRGLLLRFVLPLVGLGLVLWGVESAAEAMGYHQDVVKMLRMAVIPLYLIVAVLATRRKT
jgi:hypothetical protein